ncbi:2OG-Fe(II) oxygenase [Hyella patelloides LEGE 07179]|uniref:2OG-Fe(II) oxygenase n=1 Tax=Hyella patelloides LEGE 07179 TaxID=945734 RepID=A0A563VJC9_9CYAN|nr:2-oxoglutarate and iron-dependent oxygenase domain-containing protein [Hyella patelloides]VEP11493.1 2OG-Fe(II) oxygenase [Hyella patelloides LEGE 07179]
MSEKIPVIDFAPFREGDTVARSALAAEIYRACHEIGFMYLKHPGIDSDLIARTMMHSRAFFNLPLTEKNKLAWSDEPSNRGYVGVGRERLDESKPGDLKEAYNIGFESGSTQLKNQPSLSCNRWLEGDDRFRDTMLDFFSACNETAKVICEALAIAINLPEAFFVNNHNQQDNTLRLLHYPPIKQTPESGQLRAGEHSDYGSFTLLFQDAVGGLEVRNTRGEWIEAPFIPETVLVNTGDLMERWTNHVFCSTKHRVRIPQDQRAKQSRYAIAFFCHPNHDTEISCLKTCHSKERPSLYPPITAGDYLLSRLKATY